MTTTPNEPVREPDVVPSGDPSVQPGEDPGVPEEDQPVPVADPETQAEIEDEEPGQMPESTNTEVGA